MQTTLCSSCSFLYTPFLHRHLCHSDYQRASDVVVYALFNITTEALSSTVRNIIVRSVSTTYILVFCRCFSTHFPSCVSFLCTVFRQCLPILNSILTISSHVSFHTTMSCIRVIPIPDNSRHHISNTACLRNAPLV